VVSRNPTLRPAGISRPDSEIDEASNGKAPLLTKRGFSEKVDTCYAWTQSTRFLLMDLAAWQHVRLFLIMIFLV